MLVSGDARRADHRVADAVIIRHTDSANGDEETAPIFVPRRRKIRER